MNEQNSDFELQFILQEARDNYQKRIKNLKSSMQSICQNINEDPIKTEKNNPARHQLELNKELLQSLSKIQVLTIENENLKALIQKDPKNSFRHSNDYSQDSHFSIENQKIKDKLLFFERENNILSQNIESLKSENNNLEQNLYDLKNYTNELSEKNSFFIKKIRDLEEISEGLKIDAERAKNELKENIYKYKSLEVEYFSTQRSVKNSQYNYLSCEDIRKHYKNKLNFLKRNLKTYEKELLDKDTFFENLADQLKHDFDKEKNDIKAQFDEKISRLVADLQKANNEVNNSYEKFNSYESFIQDLSNKVVEKQKMIEENFITKETILGEEKKLFELSSKYDKQSKDLEDLKQQLSTSIEIAEKLKSELFSAKSEIKKNLELSNALKKSENENSELLLAYQDLIGKFNELESEYQHKSKEFKEMYNSEVFQHRSDVSTLESELQKFCEIRSQFNSEAEVLKEKYNILKKEYFEFQQKYHMSNSIYEKQIEEFKRTIQGQDWEIDYLNKKDSERKQEIEKYETSIEKLLSDIRASEESKIELKNSVLTLQDDLKTEKIRVLKTQDLIKISLKQLKNGFFQSIKTVHRGVFEEIIDFKKFLSETFQILMLQLGQTTKSLLSSLELQNSRKKQCQDQCFRDNEENKSLKLKESQLNRELKIREERIRHLENSLKSNFTRNMCSEQGVIRSLVQHITSLEEEYNENYSELVDLVILLKSQIKKDWTDGVKETSKKLELRDQALTSAKIEIEKLLAEKNNDYRKYRQEIHGLEQKLALKLGKIV